MLPVHRDQVGFSDWRSAIFDRHQDERQHGRDIPGPAAETRQEARRFTHYDRFIAEYCHAMLWASTEPEPRPGEPGHAGPSGTCAGCNSEFSSRSRVMRAVPEPEPATDPPWPLAAFTETSRRSIEADCADFVRANRADLDGLDPAQAGHDFAMSRNGSDLGFLRRDLGDLGDRLHLAAVSRGRSTARADRLGVMHLDEEQAEAEDPEPAASWNPRISQDREIEPADRDPELSFEYGWPDGGPERTSS